MRTIADLERHSNRCTRPCASCLARDLQAKARAVTICTLLDEATRIGRVATRSHSSAQKKLRQIAADMRSRALLLQRGFGNPQQGGE